MFLATSWLESALSLIYPNACQLCGENPSLAAEGFVCAECQRKVRFIVPPFCERCGLPYDGELVSPFTCSNCRDVTLHFTSGRSAVSAKGIVLEVIHRFKYKHAMWFEPFLAELLLRKAVPALRGGDWHGVVPVPLHSTKLREREFNQAELIARHLATALEVPLLPDAIRRTRPTRTQTLLTRQQRAENVRDAFTESNESGVRGKRLVLVDDVLTTGATTNACARMLRKMGAGEVCVWTVARGL
jgi:ComF family protein